MKSFLFYVANFPSSIWLNSWLLKFNEKFKTNFMYQITKQFNPDEKDKLGEKSNEDLKKNVDSVDKLTNQKSAEEDESVLDKIKDALQDWSNDNEKDIEEDDSSAQRSNL